MNGQTLTGIFGKLPAHGDFIYRNLPTRFINVWDTWLQGYVSSSQEQLGEQWLDIYLTSPIWRFALTPGVVDDAGWVGIVLPSVDRVGRYFPFSVARPLPAGLAPTLAITENDAWFEAVEGAALSALEGSQQIDELIPELNNFRLSNEASRRYSDRANSGQAAEANPSALGAVIVSDCEEQPPKDAVPCLLDVLLRDSLRSYSIWSTRGSQYVDPCVFYSPGLPQRRGIAAMLNGQWQAYGWQVPWSIPADSRV